MFRSRLAIGISLAIAGFGSASAGELIIPGTGDGLDMLRHVAAVYSERDPEDRIIIPPSIGSGGGRAAVAEDRALVGRIAVPLTAADEAAGLVSVPIVRVPTAFFTHASAQVSSLSTQQIAGIFSGNIKWWSWVGGPNIKIKVVRREEADSTLQVLRGTMKGWKDLNITDRSKTVVTTQAAIESVSRYDGAIGFGPYSKSLETQLSIIKVDGIHPLDPEYPSFTTIRLIFKRDQLSDGAKKFIRFAKSNEAGTIYVRYGGVPDDSEDIVSARPEQ